MQKILVTTDLSTASRAGLRFAIQLATQMEAELVFFHCFESLIPSTLHRQGIDRVLREQTEDHLQRLEQLVARVHKSMHIEPGGYSCVVMEHWDTDKIILDYAREHDFQYICMSTRGAGGLQKLIGTHTGHIVQRSEIPVIVVPHGYRTRPIRKILYASDLQNFEREMPVVAALSAALEVKTNLTHLYFPGLLPLDQENLRQMWTRKYPQLDRVFLAEYNLDQTFAEQMEKMREKLRPSVAVFFAHAHKTWFDKMFGQSLSRAMSFVTKVPMIVYRKTGG